MMMAVSAREKLYVTSFSGYLCLVNDKRHINKDILDINTGTWARVLPSGDPGTSGEESFPSPREGASVLSYQEGLVGSARNSSADTIVSFVIVEIG
jgi:hypothetical protein